MENKILSRFSQEEAQEISKKVIHTVVKYREANSDQRLSLGEKIQIGTSILDASATISNAFNSKDEDTQVNGSALILFLKDEFQRMDSIQASEVLDGLSLIEQGFKKVIENTRWRK